MSYITSTLKCRQCGYEMNVAFGIVGMTIIAQHPEECPKCKCQNLDKISDGWNAKNDSDIKPKTMAKINTNPSESFATNADARAAGYETGDVVVRAPAPDSGGMYSRGEVRAVLPEGEEWYS